ERVEGFTNPLLTLLGALIHLLGVGPRFVPLALDAVNLAASMSILWLLLRFWSDRVDRAGLFAGALYLLGGQHLFYAHAGYEVYLQGLLLVYGVTHFNRVGLAGAFLLGLLPLTHATSVPTWMVLVLALLLFHPATFGRKLALAATAALPAVAYQVFRVGYYGDWLPNTFYLKAGAGKLGGGIIYARAWLRLVLPSALLAVALLVAAARLVLRHGPRKYLGDAAGVRLVVATAVLGVHVAGVIGVGGDYFPLSRFLFPCTILLAALAGRGLDDAWLWIKGQPAAAARTGVAVAIGGVALAALAWPILNARLNAALIRGRVDWNVHHLTLGQAIQDNTPPGTWVGVFALGYASYYGDRLSIDMLGKIDHHIARMPPNPHRAIAHNKTDFGYVFSRQPDLIELALDPVALSHHDVLAAAASEQPHGYQAEEALHPIFRRDYADHPVTDQRGRFVRLYARSGSEVAAHAQSWRVPEEYFATEAGP
ncbi:MAG: arabinofuranosyltransferase, partial [Myxococcales bacterium]|nr:arabinofuranosyltransferase [Myxococcales bacterium]